MNLLSAINRSVSSPFLQSILTFQFLSREEEIYVEVEDDLVSMCLFVQGLEYV